MAAVAGGSSMEDDAVPDGSGGAGASCGHAPLASRDAPAGFGDSSGDELGQSVEAHRDPLRRDGEEGKQRRRAPSGRMDGCTIPSMNGIKEGKKNQTPLENNMSSLKGNSRESQQKTLGGKKSDSLYSQVVKNQGRARENKNKSFLSGKSNEAVKNKGASNATVKDKVESNPLKVENSKSKECSQLESQGKERKVQHKKEIRGGNEISFENEGAPPLKKNCERATPPEHGEYTPQAWENSNQELVQSDGSDESGVEEVIRAQDEDTSEITSPLSAEEKVGVKHTPDTRKLLQSLPTRQEIDTLLNVKLEGYIGRLEALMSSELQKMHSTMTEVTQKLGSLEKELGSFQSRMKRLEEEVHNQKQDYKGIALKVVDLENRNRRCNIRLRGIPETIKQENLKDVVDTIFRHYVDNPETENIGIERVHRALGRKPTNPKFSRDVVCCIHRYSLKESIMQGAREKGPYNLEGSEVILLQDLAKATLDMRRALKPLIEILRKKKIEYRWGYPFALNLRHQGRFFSLRNPSQLPEVFEFVDSPVIEIVDWHQFL